jgi:hypothetical protein
MLASAECLCTLTRRFLRLSLWTAAVCAAVLCLRSAAWAQAPDPNAPAVRLINTIPINGTAGNRATKMFSFGSSWVDRSGLYFLADRSNAAIDVIDTTGRVTGTPDSLFGQIGGAAFNFAGDTGLEATSGPNGVTRSAPCIFVTDGSSRVISINETISFVQPVASVSTGGQFRASGLAFAFLSMLLVINDADTPPFASSIPVNTSTCALGTPFRIPFKTALLNATNGAGQPLWVPPLLSGPRAALFFYVPIPEVNGPGGGGPNGGIARITMSGVPSIDAFYPINFCQPSGLAVDTSPPFDLLVQCSTVFDSSGRPCTPVVPAPGTGAAPATCAGIAYPQVAICNPIFGCTGNALVSVPGPGGGDQVWFNSDGNYYITGENNPVGPNFGIVKSGSNTLSQLVPTLPPVPAVPGVHSAGSVHSIAASPVSNHIYVPLPANTSYPNCTQGCVAVFGAQ